VVRQFIRIIQINFMEEGIMFSLSLQLMGYGLAGVFGALAVLYITVRVMTKVFPKR